MADWVRSDKFAPASPGGGSQGFSVECPATGELGHGKPTSIPQEVLAHLLAVEAVVAVPITELGTHGGSVIAVSKSWGAVSLDIPKIHRVSPAAAASDSFKAALRKGSELLPFHAWVGTGDLKDEHLMVRPGATEGEYEVASIDFASAFGWPAGGARGNMALPPGPPALLANKDAGAIAAAVARIEAITAGRISAVVRSLPDTVLPEADKERISTGLVERKEAVRPLLTNAGWM